jgi:ribonuclease III
LYTDDGIVAVQAWLRPLLKPYVREAYARIRVEHRLPAQTRPLDNPKTPSDGASSKPEISTISTVTTTTTRTTLSDDLADVAPTGHLVLLNQYVKQKKIIVEWSYEVHYGSAENGGVSEKPIGGGLATPIWTAQANLGKDIIVQGRGRTKKTAKHTAAEHALHSLGVPILESKRSRAEA